MRRQKSNGSVGARSHKSQYSFGCIRRMPRQRANVLRSRACRHGELRRFCAIFAACSHVSRSKFTWTHTANAATIKYSLLCSYGGIGRRGRFRFCWATPVQVQVLLAAFFCLFSLGFCQSLRFQGQSEKKFRQEIQFYQNKHPARSCRTDRGIPLQGCLF